MRRARGSLRWSTPASNIRNAVLNAAYIAATEQAATITHGNFVRGGRMESDVMGTVPAPMLRRVPPESN